MKSRKFYFMVVAIVFIITGCGSKAEPVSNEPTETIEGKEEIETKLEEIENDITESENITNETEIESVTSIDNASTEEVTENQSIEDNGAIESIKKETPIEIVEELDKIMFVQTTANLRSGDSTEYEKIGTAEASSELHITGRTANDWYRVDWNNGEIVYISNKLVGDSKPQPKEQSNNTGNTGEIQQPSNENSNSNDSIVDENSSDEEWAAWAESMGMEYISGGLQDSGYHWDIE